MTVPSEMPMGAAAASWFGPNKRIDYIKTVVGPVFFYFNQL